MSSTLPPASLASPVSKMTAPAPVSSFEQENDEHRNSNGSHDSSITDITAATEIKDKSRIVRNL
jgi:hypothetical protein